MKQNKDKNEVLVTIIVPMYNAEKYIGRCIKSLLSQTFKRIEIIMVDDGSVDSTVKIVNRFKKKNAEIEFVQQKHCGPNIARKKGVELANGKYIMFVDADDYLREDAIELLVGKFEKNDVDVIRFNAMRCDSKNNTELLLGLDSNDSIKNHKQVMELLFTTYKLNSLCFQIYKKDNIRNIKAFDYEVKFGEDFLVNLDIHRKTDKLLVINDVLYFYDYNSNSTSRNVNHEIIINNISDRFFC